MQRFELRSGRQLDAVGFGLWKIDPESTATAVRQAIASGYRHFDSACDYGNEAQTGEGMQQAIGDGMVSRDDLWITSKLWNSYHRPEHVRPALLRTLQDLRIDYLDLYLMHFPIASAFVPFEERYPPGWFADPNDANPKIVADRVPLIETWQAMEELAREGLIKEIGVCNFGCSLLRDLMNQADILPSVLQIELHPYLTQEKLIRFCHESGIVVTGFSPLGAQSYFALNMAESDEAVMTQPAIGKIAETHGKTAAQVLLRWGVQRGTSVVPKTSSESRMKENISLFDFELSDAEMNEISSMNRNRRFNDPGDFAEAAFNTFFPIYE